MKRIVLVLLTLLCCVTIIGCGQDSSTVYEKDGYTIDFDAETITKGNDVYTFSISEHGNQSSIDIVYPNGATYFFQWNGNSGHGGWSNDYDPERYADGDFLMDLLSFDPPEPRRGNPLAGLLVICFGLFDAISPRTAWYLSYGWRYKNAEPSDAALIIGRIGGIVCIVLGIFLLLL